MKKLFRHTDSMNRLWKKYEKDSSRWMATAIFILAILSTAYFGYRMVGLSSTRAEAIPENLRKGTMVGETCVDVEVKTASHKESQVIREIALGKLFDTEHGVTVRDLSTYEMQRVTEPGIQTVDAAGNEYSYVIEERSDGGQDLMVSICANPEKNYLISYQVMDSSTGEKEITNITVVNGTVTAESTYGSEDLTASSR